MLKIEHVKKITKEAVEIKKQKEESRKQKEEQEALDKLYRAIESQILYAAKAANTSCQVRTSHPELFNQIKEKYADFNPTLGSRDNDGEYLIQFSWE